MMCKNIITNEKIIFRSLKDACKTLNISLIGLNNNRSRFGFSSPYKNWFFSRLSDYIDNN